VSLFHHEDKPRVRTDDPDRDPPELAGVERELKQSVAEVASEPGATAGRCGTGGRPHRKGSIGRENGWWVGADEKNDCPERL